MKIENSGVNVTPKASAEVTQGRKAHIARNDGALTPRLGNHNKIDSDSVEISRGSAEKVVTSGDYSAKVLAPRGLDKLQPMSNLKKTADERLKQFGSDSDAVESVSELNLNDDRKDMVEIAKLRVNSGFYDRPDVIDEIARRIIEGV